ncbi:T9SS type A sorting domain-containing protein [Flavivirga jejuensis]|uniref:T9SS type A sorting domain-containing protein n=1 Tax=Flavivirga jejuensis TaxID=870487 RepID=A0ABT8WPX2_9FLAO|nr:T9SS type A sorting domain-containing protein [Flavivirga jejuensis]MDO5975228.1 T9SS type A sorting domain-containing protein [Flavivirga jejuensis]
MKKLFYLTVLTLYFGVVNTLNSQTLLSHHFNNGEIYPFEIPKVDQEARVSIVNKRVETHWDEDLYNGTNSGRKAQIRPENNAYHFTQEFWTGFWLKIHPDYMANNTNTDACLMQIWGHNDATGSANHYAMLKFDGRNGGALVWQHRYNSVANKDHYLIYGNFPKDTFVRVVIRVKLSSNGGIVQIWVNDVLRLSKTGQTIGWGDMNANGMYNQTYSSISYGQYNYRESAGYDQTYDSENHLFDGHMDGETRTVTYDELSLWNGSNGYAIVDPNGGGIPSSDNFQLIKRNATGFAINGGSTNASLDGRSVRLYTNINHNNLTWTEIDRGGGYYSYEKLNSGYCMDGGSGGSNGQDITMASCNASDYNQQWEKIDAGNGHYRLQKRGTNYSIDGGNGGASSQNVYLWTSSATNQNQQWRFDTSAASTSKNSIPKAEAEEPLEENLNAFSVYPSPVENQLTIKFNNNYDQETAITLHAVNGQKVIQTKPNGEELKLDLSKLNSGIYILKVNSKTQNLTKKIVKL